MSIVQKLCQVLLKELLQLVEGDVVAFAAIVEVKPVFKLPTYKGLKVEFKDVKVDDAAVNEQLDRLRAAYATYEDAKDGNAVTFPTRDAETGEWGVGSIYLKQWNKSVKLRFWDPDFQTTSALLAY